MHGHKHYRFLFLIFFNRMTALDLVPRRPFGSAENDFSLIIYNYRAYLQSTKIHGACQRSADWFIICLYTLPIDQNRKKKSITNPYPSAPLSKTLQSRSATVAMYKDQLSSAPEAVTLRRLPVIAEQRKLDMEPDLPSLLHELGGDHQPVPRDVVRPLHHLRHVHELEELP